MADSANGRSLRHGVARRASVLSTALATVAATMVAMLLMAASAQAAWQIEAFDGNLLTQAGDPVTQAGSHPWTATTSFEFTSQFAGPNEWPTEQFKDITVDLPPGLVGNVQNVPTCSQTQLAQGVGEAFGACRDETQVGVVALAWGAGVLASERFYWTTPVYNMEAPKGVAAEFGFSLYNTITHVSARVRTGDDYGVSVDVRNASAALPLVGSSLTFWGVPADPAWDPFRGDCLDILSGGSLGGSCPSDAPRNPLLTLPTSCAGPQETFLHATSWQGSSDSASFISHDNELPPNPIGVDGCESVPFEPTLAMQPTSSSVGSSSGLDVDLSVPQDGLEDPAGVASGHLKKAVVTLPEGMTVNPSAANGLEACSPAQIGLSSPDPASCPDASKLGSVEVDSPLVDHTMEGEVYLAQQGSFEGSLVGLYIVADDPETGVVLKVGGKVDRDATTGQLTTTFDNNPQLPFSNLHLKLNGGPRGSLVLPKQCGTYTANAVLTSWSGATVTTQSSFDVTADASGSCDASSKFAPGFAAGMSNPVAGSSSPFNLRLTRGDSDQELSSVSVDMPQGLLARISQVDQCPADAAAAGTCGVGSQIGSVTTGAGAGSSPFYITNGRAYLTGPYKGAPFGLSIVVPAVAGPFDLGTVVVRSALHVDPNTAAVKVVSDPFPTILEGIPLRVRDVRVNADRPGFMINPTSCAPMQIAATVTSTSGATASPTERFQVGDCGALSFAPKLSLALTGRKQVTTGKHPGVKAVVTQKASGAAGIKKAVVRLPKALALDPDNAQALCEFVDGTKPDLEKHCPAGSIVGRAKATTPLLDKPLAGNVYFVKNVRIDRKTGNQIRTLPMIVVALRGEIAVNLKGESSTTRGGQLVNTFASVPDAPVTKFNLNIKGGSNGILAVTRTAKSKINLCNAPRTAEVDLDGHNGKQADFNTRVKTPCAKKAKKGAKRR